jgi:type III pantothenate kinase
MTTQAWQDPGRRPHREAQGREAPAATSAEPSGEALHLVVDVGNTESVVGLFAPGAGGGPEGAGPATRPGAAPAPQGAGVGPGGPGGAGGAPQFGSQLPPFLLPLATWRYTSVTPRTPDELALLLRAFLRDAGSPRLARAVVGSVVPAQTDLLRPALARLVEGPVWSVTPGTDLPIRLSVDEPRTVGADRIVNTLAARHLYGRDTVVVDLGTATTYDCISAEGDFLGGVIAPGLMAGQEWLAGRTAKLPRVEFEPPPQVIGKRTDLCLKAGIFYSAVDAMDGIVRRILAEWERPEALVVGTGGHARTLAPHSATMNRVEPWLTLVGLELAGRYLAGEPLPGPPAYATAAASRSPPAADSGSAPASAPRPGGPGAEEGGRGREAADAGRPDGSAPRAGLP